MPGIGGANARAIVHLIGTAVDKLKLHVAPPPLGKGTTHPLGWQGHGPHGPEAMSGCE